MKLIGSGLVKSHQTVYKILTNNIEQIFPHRLQNPQLASFLFWRVCACAALTIRSVMTVELRKLNLYFYVYLFSVLHLFFSKRFLFTRRTQQLQPNFFNFFQQPIPVLTASHRWSLLLFSLFFLSSLTIYHTHNSKLIYYKFDNTWMKTKTDTYTHGKNWFDVWFIGRFKSLIFQHSTATIQVDWLCLDTVRSFLFRLIFTINLFADWNEMKPKYFNRNENKKRRWKFIRGNSRKSGNESERKLASDLPFFCWRNAFRCVLTLNSWSLLLSLSKFLVFFFRKFYRHKDIFEEYFIMFLCQFSRF